MKEETIKKFLEIVNRDKLEIDLVPMEKIEENYLCRHSILVIIYYLGYYSRELSQILSEDTLDIAIEIGIRLDKKLLKELK